MAKKVKSKKKPVVKKTVRAKSMSKPMKSTSSPVKMTKPRFAKLNKRLKKFAKNTRLERSTLKKASPWAVFVICGAILYFFSAVTAGSFSHQDLYVINFDHNPSENVLNQTFREQGVEVEDTQVINGNTLQVRTTTDVEGFRRAQVVEKLQEQDGVLSAQGYRVFPIDLASRYQFQVVTAGLYLLIATIIYLTFTYRKDLLKGVEVFVKLYMTVFMVGFVAAVAGIGLSKLDFVYFTKTTADIFVTLLLVASMIKIYLLSKKS